MAHVYLCRELKLCVCGVESLQTHLMFYASKQLCYVLFIPLLLISDILIVICQLCGETTQQGAEKVCGQPQAPENGHIAFSSSGRTIVGSTVRYECDIGFTRLGPALRMCNGNGTWSESPAVCTVNVALYRPAKQPGERTAPNGDLLYANLSTDGNLETCSFSKSFENPSWWMVDLLQEFKVYAVEIFYRKSVSGVSLLNLEVYVGNHGINRLERDQLCFAHQGVLSAGDVHTFICYQEIKGRYVTILAKDNSTVSHGLSLCEVMVLSRDTASFWQCQSLPEMDRWGVFQGRCYHSSQVAKPWYDAKKQCEDSGSSLITVHEGIEQIFLHTQLQHRAKEAALLYWIGGHNDASGRWQWYTGEKIDSGFWSRSAVAVPSNGAYAVALSRSSSWFWSPVSQSTWNYFLCITEPIFCGSPGIPSNGGVMLSRGDYAIGTVAYYYCSHGHVVVGGDQRICLLNGTWSGPIPRCLAVECGIPRKISLGSVRLLNSSSLYGSLARYECSKGFQLYGNATHRCDSDGRWVGLLPECRPLSCGMPHPVEHSNLSLIEGHTEVGGLVEYECHEGFRILGSNLRHCAANGSWIPDPPKCYDVFSLKRALVEEDNGLEGVMVENPEKVSSLVIGFIATVVFLVIFVALVGGFIYRRRRQITSNTGSYIQSLYSGSSTVAPVVTPGEVLYAYGNVASPPSEHVYYASLPQSQLQKDSYHMNQFMGTLSRNAFTGLIPSASSSDASNSDDINPRSNTSSSKLVKTPKQERRSMQGTIRPTISAPINVYSTVTPMEPVTPINDTTQIVYTSNGSPYLVSSLARLGHSEEPIPPIQSTVRGNPYAPQQPPRSSEHYQALETLLVYQQQRDLFNELRSNHVGPAGSTLPRNGLVKKKRPDISEQTFATVRVKSTSAIAASQKPSIFTTFQAAPQNIASMKNKLESSYNSGSDIITASVNKLKKTPRLLKKNKRPNKMPPVPPEKPAELLAVQRPDSPSSDLFDDFSSSDDDAKSADDAAVPMRELSASAGNHRLTYPMTSSQVNTVLPLTLAPPGALSELREEPMVYEVPPDAYKNLKRSTVTCDDANMYEDPAKLHINK